jgi:hypothetical protein
MLAVVRLGRGCEAMTLERLSAVCGEHCPQLVIVGVWRPAWWLWLRAGCIDLAPLIAVERASSEQVLRDFGGLLGAEVRPTVALGSVATAVGRELERCRYEYLIGPRRDLSPRLVRRWRDRHPRLAVMTV